MSEMKGRKKKRFRPFWYRFSGAWLLVGEDQRIGDVRHLVITTTQQHYMELVKTNEDV